MNWDAIGAIGEAIGAAAVVASLMYLASQIRADAQARNHYFHHNEGHLDQRVWQGFEGPMDDIIVYPSVQDWWKTRCHWYSREFQSFIAGKIEKGRRPSMYRESTA